MNVSRKLFLSAALLILLILLGTFGYVLIEDWTVDDALYMTLITMSTVGFKEVAELDANGRWLTILIIAAGLTLGYYTLTTITTYFVGGHILQTIRDKKMDKKLNSLRNHVILAGYGKLGREVAMDLQENNIEFCIIEMDSQRAERARLRNYFIIEGDASDEELLEKAGISNAKSLIAALTGDAGNVMVTITAREINPNLFIVARGIDDASEARLRRAGADRVEMPFRISGKRLTTLVQKPSTIEFMDLFSKTFAKELFMEQFFINEEGPLDGRSIIDCDIRNATDGAVIMAVESEEGKITLQPPGNYVFNGHDRVLVLGNDDQISKFATVFKLT